MGMLKVGIFPPGDVMGAGTSELRKSLDEMVSAGLDHVASGDHISFFVGFGVDGLINATALASLNDELEVFTAVYLLPLRHPVLVARQIATLSTIAPGRLVFGVGVGGEDRHEVEVCSVDPSTRGRRMDECLEILSGLMAGSAVDFSGEFFELEKALIVPAPRPVPKVIVGGRSEAAIRRAGRFGDGWIGTWVSPTRFRAATEQISDQAEKAGREEVEWQHAIQVWCGFGDSTDEARGRVANAMQALYQIPFEKFEKWSPYGSPESVAEFLWGYVEAGCTMFNLLPQAANGSEAIAIAGEIKRILEAEAGKVG